MSSEDWDGWKEWKKQEKAERWEKNMETLTLSGVEFTTKNQGDSLLFREEGKPPVDFYPSTGRWRVVGKDAKTFKGGATAFLNWYKHQKPIPTPQTGTKEAQGSSQSLLNEKGQKVKPYNDPVIPPWDDDAPENELE